MVLTAASSQLVVGAMLAVFATLALIALYYAVRLYRLGRKDVLAAARVQALLATAPAIAAIVRADGRIDATERLADWLGLPSVPRFVTDLGAVEAGLTPGDLENLQNDIIAAQKSGRPFTRSVRPQGSARSLTIKGQRAPRDAQAPGGIVLWVFDATESQQEIARLGDEASRIRAAFDALSGLIEAAPLPMWYRGPDLRLMMVNSAYVDAVEGSHAEDVVARGLELVEGSGIGGPLASAVVARESGKPQMQAMPATILGQRRMLKVFDVPLPTGGVAGFAVDIEDLEQARSGLKRFAEAQRAMLDRLSAGVVQFAADRSLVFCNQPFQRLFAMRSEWLADRPEFDRVLERMREANRLPEVRDFPGWKAERRDWFVATDSQIEEQWHLPGGVHLRVVAQPLPDGGLLLIFEDRTEQVQLASARDTLLRVRSATFDNLFEALGVFAADGRLQLWNNRFRAVWDFDEAFLSQHPRVDALAKIAQDKLATPSQSVLITELVRSATAERQQRGGRVALADGRHFEFAAVPLPDGNALFTMLDVTDRQRVERALRDRNEALEAADKVKTAFVANMSYELRTPLTSISGFGEMLQAGYAGALPQMARDYVEAIMESVARLSTLVDDVLDLTLGQKDGPELERFEVDLERIARAAADRMRPIMAKRGLDFAVELQPSTGSISGDARRLTQTIENMLRHAVSGTPEGGRVLLHTDGTAAKARIVVSDNGRGMTARAIARAFDRFAEPGPTRNGERALGLDLPLAKQFAEAHGGSIDLVSEPGQGTLITVELPRR
ncbi:MAG: PAS-domain containing protein [Sphingomonas sp.]